MSYGLGAVAPSPICAAAGATCGIEPSSAIKRHLRRRKLSREFVDDLRGGLSFASLRCDPSTLGEGENFASEFRFPVRSSTRSSWDDSTSGGHSACSRDSRTLYERLGGPAHATSRARAQRRHKLICDLDDRPKRKRPRSYFQLLLLDGYISCVWCTRILRVYIRTVGGGGGGGRWVHRKFDECPRRCISCHVCIDYMYVSCVDNVLRGEKGNS